MNDKNIAYLAWRYYMHAVSHKPELTINKADIEDWLLAKNQIIPDELISEYADRIIELLEELNIFSPALEQLSNNVFIPSPEWVKKNGQLIGEPNGRLWAWLVDGDIYVLRKDMYGQEQLYAIVARDNKLKWSCHPNVPGEAVLMAAGVF